jgi:hypothetical protein
VLEDQLETAKQESRDIADQMKKKGITSKAQARAHTAFQQSLAKINQLHRALQEPELSGYDAKGNPALPVNLKEFLKQAPGRRAGWTSGIFGRGGYGDAQTSGTLDQSEPVPAP